jgi:hypothetical protein
MEEHYRYKNHQLISQTITGNELYFQVNTNTYVDKLRISLSGTAITNNQNQPGLLVYSDLVGNYIGSFSTDYCYNNSVGRRVYNDPLEPVNGVEYYFTHQVMLGGEYRLNLFYLDGTPPAAGQINNGELNLLLEYYRL